MYQGLTKDVSSVVGAPWRCGVLTTQGGIAGIGLGRLLGGEHESTLQEWSGGSSPVKAEPHQIVLLLLLSGYIVLEEYLLVKGLTLANFFSLIFVGEMCVFVSCPMNIVTFLQKNGDPAKRVVDFPQERDIPKRNHGNRRGFCV